MKGMVGSCGSDCDWSIRASAQQTFCCSCVFIFVHTARQQPAIRTKRSPDQAAWFHRQHVRSKDENEVCRHDGMHAFEAWVIGIGVQGALTTTTIVTSVFRLRPHTPGNAPTASASALIIEATNEHTVQLGLQPGRTT